MGLIDVDEAVKIIKQHDDKKIALDELTRITDAIAKEIEEMPTVDVEPERHGTWIAWYGMDIPENHGRHKCSECGEFAVKPKYGEEILTKRCLECGALMDCDVKQSHKKLKTVKKLYASNIVTLNGGISDTLVPFLFDLLMTAENKDCNFLTMEFIRTLYNLPNKVITIGVQDGKPEAVIFDIEPDGRHYTMREDENGFYIELEEE